jgi:hypothetical protein
MPEFGRKLLHDPKSREHEFALTKPTRRDVHHPMFARHVDQFYLGGCVGFSGTNLLNTVSGVHSRMKYNKLVPLGKGGNTYLGNDDGIKNYHEATLRDPFEGQYPPDDDGSSAIGLMKWWKDAGIITRYSWTFTFDAFLAALEIQPVLVGSMWYDDMMETDENGIVRSSADGDGGGHEYMANKIKWDARLIGYEQSWGEHPEGFNPSFWMSFELAEELIIHQEGDVAVPHLL